MLMSNVYDKSELSLAVTTAVDSPFLKLRYEQSGLMIGFPSSFQMNLLML